MPHSTTETLTNGETSKSKFISHITSYPVVQDGIETYKSNPYGKKSLEIADGAYTRFGKPVEPYLQKPYTYAQPYVQKADELADTGLTKVEGYVPIVKEDTHTIVDTAKSYAFWPYNYLTGTFNDEYTKTAQHNDRGAGIITFAMATVSTELKIASDFFQVVADFLGPKYQESKKKGDDYVRDLQNKASHYKDAGADKLGEYARFGQQKVQEAQKAGEEKTQEAKDQASKTKEDAKDQANKTKEEAKAKTQK